MYVQSEDVGARLSSSLCSVVNADGDNGVGDERAVAAVLVEQFQTAHHHSHIGAIVGERVHNLSDMHLVRGGEPLVSWTTISSAVAPTSRANPRLLM